MILRVAAIVLSVLTGAVFLVSAIAKIYPIEPFEYTLVEAGIAGWQSSVIIARLFIGIEFACGVLLILNIWLKRFTLPFTALMLVVFNIYLVLQIITFGNKGNCGCFGNWFHFTPAEAIIKNIILLAACAFIYIFHKGFRFKYYKIVTTVLVLAGLILPFILNPVSYAAAQKHYSGELNYKAELDLLYRHEKIAPPKVELRKGKWIIAFMSLKCPHCRIAAKKLQIMKNRNAALPIYLVLNGNPDYLDDFFDDTKATNLGWSLFNSGKQFFELAGPRLPEIEWVNNGIVENRSDYIFMDQREIETWFKK